MFRFYREILLLCYKTVREYRIKIAIIINNRCDIEWLIIIVCREKIMQQIKGFIFKIPCSLFQNILIVIQYILFLFFKQGLRIILQKRIRIHVCILKQFQHSPFLPTQILVVSKVFILLIIFVYQIQITFRITKCW